MIQADQDIAEQVIETQLIDCLQAHIARAKRMLTKKLSKSLFESLQI